MLRRKPTMIEVKMEDKEEIELLKSRRMNQQSHSSSVIDPPVSSSATILHRNIGNIQLDAAEKAKRLGIEES